MNTALIPTDTGWELAGKPAPDMLSPGQVAQTLDGAWWASTGLMLPDSLSYERWERIGSLLMFLEKSVHFAIGDWIRFGERAYGEKYSQAILETPYSEGTLRNDAWVASRIDISRRRDNLPFAHHQAVAKLEPEEQERYLDEAEREALTVVELRNRVRSALPAPVADRHAELDEIGHLLDSAMHRLIALSETNTVPPAEIQAVLDAMEDVFREMRVLRSLSTEKPKRGQPMG